MTVFQRLNQLLNRYAGHLLVGGLLWIGWRNWRQWRQTTRPLCQPSTVTPLPSLATWPQQPLVSVVVAAWNEEPYLATFLQSFCALAYPHKELILCVGGTDAGYQIAAARSSTQITVLQQREGEGKWGALKRMAPLVKGKIVFLTDADCILNSAGFLRLIHPLVVGGETMATGHVRPFPDQLNDPLVRVQWAAYRRFQLSEQASSSPYTMHITGANCALHRDLFVESCQSIADIQIGEDLYLALYAQSKGHRLLRVYESYVESEFPTSLRAYIRQQCRWNKTKWLYHAHFGALEAAQGYMRLAQKRQILLAMPLLTLFWGKLGAISWLLAWAYGFSPYWQNQCFAIQTGMQSRIDLYHALVLMVANYYAWAIVPLELKFAKRRNRW